MTDREGSGALTPDDPAFAAGVIEATRALIEQVAVWARKGPASADTDAIIPGGTDEI